MRLCTTSQLEAAYNTGYREDTWGLIDNKGRHAKVSSCDEFSNSPDECHFIVTATLAKASSHIHIPQLLVIPHSVVKDAIFMPVSRTAGMKQSSRQHDVCSSFERCKTYISWLNHSPKSFAVFNISDWLLAHTSHATPVPNSQLFVSKGVNDLHFVMFWNKLAHSRLLWRWCQVNWVTIQ